MSTRILSEWIEWEKLNKNVLNRRLALVEQRLNASAMKPEWEKRSEQITPLLKMMDVFRRKNEMEEASMTVEERIAKHQRESSEREANTKAHYGEMKMWFEMTPQEREALDAEIDKGAEKARNWLASDEHKQFETEYAEFIKKQEGRTPIDHLA